MLLPCRLFLHSPYHTTISPEYFQKLYIQKRQGIEIYLTPSNECDFIQSEVYKNSHLLGKRNDKILYYDCTNYYFEIEQEDGDKKYEKSKEHRPNPIIQMGMFMDGDGMPLAFSLFPGNANEQTSLKPLETKVLQDFGCPKITLFFHYFSLLHRLRQ